MKQLIALCLLIISIAACKGKVSEEGNEKEELQPLAYTLYTAKSDLFVEFKPLVVGQTSKFAAHLLLTKRNQFDNGKMVFAAGMYIDQYLNDLFTIERSKNNW